MNGTWWVHPDQLDGAQRDIVEVLPIGKSYLILGPPGSGKTNILLLRANYLYLAGHQNINILVFTRFLREFIVGGGTQYDFPPDKVNTHIGFERDLLFSYGVKPTLPDDFEATRHILLNELQGLIRKKGLAKSFDVLLLDEAHDYWPEEIAVFRRLAGSVFATADPQQKIYQGDDTVEPLKTAVDETHTLENHYRIGREICKVADALAKDTDQYTPLLDGSMYDEISAPSKVDPPQRFDSVEQQTQAVLQSLRLQLDTYPGEVLGVLCPRTEDMDGVRQTLEASDLAAVTASQGTGDVISFEPETRVVLCTVHSAKGLEFRTVHIAAAEGFKRFQHQRNMAFTAVTRGKTRLSVYHSKELPGYLQQALAVVEAPKPLPKLKHLFGGKKTK